MTPNGITYVGGKRKKERETVAGSTGERDRDGVEAEWSQKPFPGKTQTSHTNTPS